MKRARALSIAQENKRTNVGECFFLDLPRETRGEVRRYLDVRERYRLHFACHVTYEDEPRGFFDFPENWLETIYCRPCLVSDSTSTTEDWTTYGDLARGVWTLGWHCWRELVACTSAVAHGPMEFHCGMHFHATATSAIVEYWAPHPPYATALVWSPVEGLCAAGSVPIPRDEVRDDLYDRRDILEHETAIVEAFLRSVALKHVAIDNSEHAVGDCA